MGLADETEACFKLWKSVLFKGQDIGSLVRGGYSNGKSVILRFIRKACKAVSHGGCEN